MKSILIAGKKSMFWVHIYKQEKALVCRRSNPNIQAFMRQMEFGNDYSLLEQYYMQK